MRGTIAHRGCFKQPHHLCCGTGKHNAARSCSNTFERASGRSFTIEHIAEAALLAKLRGATNPLEETFAVFMLDYANGCVMDMQETIAILPRRLASLE
jgi:hypothetical protein